MSIGAIILAAGKGTRMKSGTAKVLHELFYQPMLLHVLDTVLAAKIPRPIVVIGHQKEEVAALLSGRPVENPHRSRNGIHCCPSAGWHHP